MGWVLSKFRKSKSTMEILTKLESDINNISQFKASTVVSQKKVVGYLVTYSIVIYLLLAIFAYFKLFPAARDTKDRFFLILPFLVFPGIIWGLRKLLTWWYHRKIIRDEKKLELLKQRKLKLLDEVMEKETYKVAKEILDKFGDKNQGVAKQPLPGMSAIFKPGPGSENQLRRRPVDQARPELNKTVPVRGTPGGSTSSPSLTGAKPTGSLASGLNATRPTPTPGTPGPAPALAPSSAPSVRPPGGPGGRSVPGPPLPRPVLPRERGYLDKFVEFLVGDGPTNRYALICRQCESHNGMALREEFEYIAFRCCYCYYWNPARKQRPVAPRLTPAAERPAVQSASDSSGSDISAPNSAPASRRESVSEPVAAIAQKQEKTEGKTEEDVTPEVEVQAEPNTEVQSEEIATSSGDPSPPPPPQVNEEDTEEEIKEAVSENEVEPRKEEENEENNIVEKNIEEKGQKETFSNCENEMEVDS